MGFRNRSTWPGTQGSAHHEEAPDAFVLFNGTKGSGARSRSERELGVRSSRVVSTKPKRVHQPEHRAEAGLIFRRSTLQSPFSGPAPKLRVDVTASY